MPKNGQHVGPINKLAESIHFLAREKGFWANEHEVSFPAQRIALMHSELSEALESVRDGDYAHAEVEFADTIIRILDAAYAWGMDMDRAIENKMKVNEGRPHMHGRKM